MTARNTLLLGAILAFLAVAIGAFGAHAWQDLLAVNATKEIFETASQYHFIHAITLLWLGLYRRGLNAGEARYLTLSAYLFLTGTVIFSGSLYCLAISNLRWLGAITPIGGAAFLVGWVCLALAVWRA